MNMSESQAVHTEQWDRDKAEAMAYLLVTRTEFPDLMDTQEKEIDKLHEKRHRIIEKSTQRSADIESEELRDERTFPLRQFAVATRAALEEAEVEIELIEVRDKHVESSTLASNELLEEYSRFYDTDPERFSSMAGEEFGGHIQKVDDHRQFIMLADEGLLSLKDMMYMTDLYGKKIEADDQPRIDWAVVDVARDNFKVVLKSLFGRDSEEVTRLMEEYNALNDSSYDSYTPKAMAVAYCELNRKWHQFISDSKVAKEAELESLLSAHGSTETSQ
jgi:hypothetical protein